MARTFPTSVMGYLGSQFQKKNLVFLANILYNVFFYLFLIEVTIQNHIFWHFIMHNSSESSTYHYFLPFIQMNYYWALFHFLSLIHMSHYLAKSSMQGLVYACRGCIHQWYLILASVVGTIWLAGVGSPLIPTPCLSNESNLGTLDWITWGSTVLSGGWFQRFCNNKVPCNCSDAGDKLFVGGFGEGSWVFLSLKWWSCLIWDVEAVSWLLECLEMAGCSH